MHSIVYWLEKGWLITFDTLFLCTIKNIFTFFIKIFATIKFYTNFAKSIRHNYLKNNAK